MYRHHLPLNKKLPEKSPEQAERERSRDNAVAF
jgi:hypothetical protein